jgi:hypothetical protein
MYGACVWLGFALGSLAMVEARPAAPSESIGRPDTSDAIIVYKHPPSTAGVPRRETWHKHGDRVRVDVLSNSVPQVAIQRFTRPGQKVVVSLSRGLNGVWNTLVISDDPLSALPALADRTFTGVTETHLREACRVWQVEHVIAGSNKFIQSGCLNNRGIELWWKQGTVGMIIADSIVYQSVPSGDVRLPFKAIELSAWTPLKSGNNRQSDYRVELTPSQGASGDYPSKLIQIQSGVWKSVVISRSLGAYSYRLENASNGIAMHYSSDEKGQRNFSISRNPNLQTISRQNRGVRIQGKAGEVILKTPCEWSDMARGVSDVSHFECLSANGIPLKSISSSWGSSSIIVARVLKQSPQNIQPMLPTVPFQKADFWGF